MVKLKKSWVVAAAATAAVSSSALASSLVTVTRFSNASMSVGGEFTITGSTSGLTGGFASSQFSNPPANSFQSFCLEIGEFVVTSAGNNEYRSQVNTQVISGVRDNPSGRTTISSQYGLQGSVSWADGTTALSQGTVWLYERFRSGALATDGYVYATGQGRKDSAGQLQLAIWYFQYQINFDNPDDLSSNAFIAAANSVLGDGRTAFDFNTSSTQVRALNLGPKNGTGWRNQDMLTLIPLPSGGGLAAAGLMGLVALRRRRA